MREESLGGDGREAPSLFGPDGPRPPAGAPRDADGSTEVVGLVTGGSSYRMLLVVAAVVAAIVGLLAMLGRSASDDTGENGAEQADDQPLPTLPGFFTTPSGPPSTPAPAPTSTSTTATTLVPGEFLLGEPTGLWLFYGGTDPLQRLDLDSAAVVQYGLQAFPLLATGDDLVVHQRTSGVTGWVSIEEPGEQALNWKRGPVATDDEPGRLWILDPESELAHPAGEAAGTGLWELINLADNRIVERRPGELYDELEDEVAFPGSSRIEVATRRPGPDLSSRPDGVYAYADTGYRRVAGGRLLAFDEELVLVGECDAGGCLNRWLDRASGVEVELPAPRGEVVFADLLAGGRWLHTIDDDSGASLLELDTGRRLDFAADAFPAVSPDGRWIAVLTDQVTVIDGFSGRAVAELNLFERQGNGRLVFAAR